MWQWAKHARLNSDQVTDGSGFSAEQILISSSMATLRGTSIYRLQSQICTASLRLHIAVYLHSRSVLLYIHTDRTDNLRSRRKPAVVRAAPDNLRSRRKPAVARAAPDNLRSRRKPAVSRATPDNLRSRRKPAVARATPDNLRSRRKQHSSVKSHFGVDHTSAQCSLGSNSRDKPDISQR